MRSGAAAAAGLVLAIALAARAEEVSLVIEGEEPRAVVVTGDDLEPVGVWIGVLDPPARLASARAIVRADAEGRATVSIDFDPDAPSFLLVSAKGRAPVLADPRGPKRVAPPAAATARGTLVDAAGEPVAKARVLWLLEPPGNMLRPLDRPLLGWTATTDAEGAWTIADVSVGPAVVVVQAGERGVLVRENVWPGGEALALALPVPASISGTVRLESSGDPAAGATVRLVPGDEDPFLDPWEAVAGEDGSFRIKGLPAARLTLDVDAAIGFPIVARRVVLRPGEAREEIDVVLRPFAALTGRVGSVATDPLAGAEVYLVYPRVDEPSGAPPDPWTPAAITDAAGRFTIERLPPQTGVTMIVRHAAHAPKRLEGVVDLVGGVTTEVTPVLLESGVVVRGVVTEGPEGEAKPAPGVPVSVVPADEDGASVFATGRSLGARHAVSDGEGAFVVAGLAPGRYRLVARSRTSRLLVGVPFEALTGETTADVRLIPGGTVLGVIAARDLGPVEGASVRAVDTIGTELAAARSGADGAFALVGLEAAEVSVVVEAEGFLSARVDSVVTGRHLRVTLDALGAIEGRVRPKGAAPEPAEDEPPLPGFTIGVHRWTGADALGRRDADRLEAVWVGRSAEGGGAFAIPDLAPGRYRVEVELADGRSGSLDGVIVTAGATVKDVVVPVSPGGAIVGQVFDRETGRPIEGASVRLVPRGLDAGAARIVASTDDAGAFRLPHVPEGRRTIELRARDHAPRRLEGIEVLDGLVERIDDVFLGLGARVEIEAIAPGGGPLAGATFTIEDAVYGIRQSGTTDLEGHLVFDRLPEGGHRVDGPGGSWTIALERDEVRSLRVDLAGAGRVEGRVTRAGRPVPGIVLEAIAALDDPRADRRVVSATTDDDGVYDLGRIAPGRWRVRMRPAGGELVSVQRTVQVAGRAVARLDFELPEGGIVGTLLDDRSAPVEGGVLVLRGERGVERGRTVSDADGAFAFAPLADGAYRVEAYHASHGGVTSDPIVVAGEGGLAASVRIHVARAGSVVGRVVALRDRAALGDAWVTVHDLAGRPATLRDRIRVDRDGAFRVDALASGRYVVYAEAPGYARAAESPVDVVEGGETRLSFLLEEEARLEVRVFGPGGRPLRSAEVEVRDAFGRRRIWPLDRDAFGPADLDRVERPEWLTDAGGRVVVPHLGPGVHVVLARFPRLEGEPGRILVQTGAPNRIAVVLLPGK